MKKRSLWFSAAGALLVAALLAGCGSTTYFAGRQLPPSGLTNRVLIAIQNPSSLSKGALQVVDAYYDTRFKYNSTAVTYSISGFSGALPISIQNMPEEQLGAVYGSGDGSLTMINYAKESTSGATKGISGTSSSVFVSRSQAYVVAATQVASTQYVTVINQTLGQSVPLGLADAYRVSMNPGGSVALAFARNSNYIYYPRQLTAAQTIQYSGGNSTWPAGATDCEPQNGPLWCLFQLQSPTGTPLVFDRPIKAIFSADGGTAYILNCGPECGGSVASVTAIPVAPLIFLAGQQSGAPPTQAAVNSATLPILGGATNALLSGSTMYVVGQQIQPDGLYAGNLSVVNLANNTITSTASISDGVAGGVSRMILADDNTLWIGMTHCNQGERQKNGLPYGCLTMYNTSSNTVTLLEPYLGDATGIANVEGLHKVYVAEAGQVYIFSTKDGTSINNQYVTVTGTAWDVAYMDGTSDSNNTVY